MQAVKLLKSTAKVGAATITSRVLGFIRDMVLAKRAAHEIRHHALMTAGLNTLQEDGIAKALLGLTTLEEVVRETVK